MKIKNINDLKKEMMKAKRTDKDKANALMMLLDYTQKIAKEKNEEPSNEHLKQAVKKYLKIIEDSEKNGVINEKEKEIILEIKNQIFPPQFTEIELTHIIIEFLNDNPNAKQGQIMGWLKKQFGDRVDMKLANKVVQKIFKG
jgi:uncharacterized protein YqeY